MESEPLIKDTVTIDLLFSPNFQEEEDARTQIYTLYHRFVYSQTSSWGNKILKHWPSGLLQRFAINLDVTWCSLMDLMSKCLPQLHFLSHWSATQDFTITLNTQPTFF